jgi:hypothetical protein
MIASGLKWPPSAVLFLQVCWRHGSVPLSSACACRANQDPTRSSSAPVEAVVLDVIDAVAQPLRSRIEYRSRFSRQNRVQHEENCRAIQQACTDMASLSVNTNDVESHPCIGKSGWTRSAPRDVRESVFRGNQCLWTPNRFISSLFCGTTTDSPGNLELHWNP